MSLTFSRKQQPEPASRNYDVANVGFCPLPYKSEREEKLDSTIIKGLACVFFSGFVSAIGYGIIMVMVSLKLETHIKNELLISISSITQIGSGIVLSRFLPAIGQRFGLIKTIYLGSLISAISCLFLQHYVGYIFWLITIFALGGSFFVCGVTRSTLTIDLAPTKYRSIIISINNMMIAIGNSLGPLIVSQIQAFDSTAPLIIASATYLISIIFIGGLKKIATNFREEKKIGVFEYIKNSPKIMCAGFVVSYSMSSATAFLIIYGIKIGLSKENASLLLSVLLMGTILYPPIGYLADIVNRRVLMICAAFCSLICSTILYLNHNQEIISFLLFTLFACLAGMKLPAVVLINEKYKPTQRLAVNSAFSRVSIFGNITGLIITGFIMRSVGAGGLWLSICLALSFFLVFCFFNYWKKMVK